MLVRPTERAGVAAAQVVDDGAAVAARTGARSAIRRGPLLIGIVGAGLLTAGCATASRSSPIDDAKDAGLQEIRRRAPEHSDAVAPGDAGSMNLDHLMTNGRFWATGESLVGMQVPIGSAGPTGPTVGWYRVQELVGDPDGYWDLDEANAAAESAMNAGIGVPDALQSRWIVVDNPIRDYSFVVRVQHVQTLGVSPDPANVPMGARIVGDHRRY